MTKGQSRRRWSVSGVSGTRRMGRVSGYTHRDILLVADAVSTGALVRRDGREEAHDEIV